ncbi:MAG: hypothetical protein KKI08_27585 [Armatimonadetes bacterium]|nr:hypothetical protein [Armatimonadota bacterium]
MRILSISGWYKGRPSSEEQTELMTSLAETALINYENMDQIGALAITIGSAYDLGIAQGNLSFNETLPVEVWRQRVVNQ